MTLILCINIIITRLIISTTTRTIYRAIWLIIAFINAALLLTILEIEFLAILIIIIYVGAIAILFLFAIMMLNLNTPHQPQEKTHLLPIRILIIITLTYKLIEKRENNEINSTIQIHNENNLENIRKLIYSDLRTLFLISRLILLIRMITAIIITNKERKRIITQQINKQIQRLIIKK